MIGDLGHWKSKKTLMIVTPAVELSFCRRIGRQIGSLPVDIFYEQVIDLISPLIAGE